MVRNWTAGRLVTLALVTAIAGVFAQPAAADPTNLTGGILIAHYCPECFSYTYDPPAGGWCAAYEPYAIQSLEEVIAALPASLDAQLWYVLAAWEIENKTWCGTEFGIGDYDPAVYAFAECGVCAPGGFLEIPTAGWPGPNEGTAFVTTGTPWSGNWVPVYYFGGYSYAYTGSSTTIPLDVDPPTGFCGFSNCVNPPVLYEVGPEQRGIIGVNAPGYVPGWPLPPQTGACCLVEPLGACEELYEPECILAGGEWLGAGSTCNPNPCPLPGACCIGGVCEVLLQASCELIQGTFQGELTTCDPNPCEAVCCHESGGHVCEIMLQADCLAIQGFWHPEWTTCDPNPCEIYTPTEESSWGKIKSIYR